MTEALFGAPAGFLRRLSRSEVQVSDVRAAVDRIADAGPDPDLQLDVVDGGRGPMLVLEDAGRCTRVLLGALAVEMSRARVPATPDGVTAALRGWLARRPVPDRRGRGRSSRSRGGRTGESSPCRTHPSRDGGETTPSPGTGPRPSAGRSTR